MTPKCFRAGRGAAISTVLAVVLLSACGSDDDPAGETAQPGADAGAESGHGDTGAIETGGEDGGAESGTQDDAAASGVTATVSVPSDFSAVPVKLAAYFYTSIPPMGPPQGMGSAIQSPAIAPGSPLEFETNDAGLVGEYYLMLVLFVEGGGTMMPEAGVDYMGQSGPITLGAGPVDVGDIELALY